MTAIVWFRCDLRLTDNPALSEAAATGEVLPVSFPEDERTGSAARLWLNASLERLRESLDGRLHILSGSAAEKLPALCKAVAASAVHINGGATPHAIAQEAAVEKAIAPVPLRRQQGNLLYSPAQLLKPDGGVYKVFTPFYRRVLARLNEDPPVPLPRPPRLRLASDSMPDERLPEPPPWGRKIFADWQPGEAGAASCLENFLDRIDGYSGKRDFLAENGTSRLSPHLRFGELSPTQIFSQVANWESPYLRQVIWREFSYTLLHDFPELATRNWNGGFDHFPWKDDSGLIEKWRRGETGYPIVDAAMRELWNTGTMHNRARMIVASFLTKNLLCHWRHGAAWFWDCLLDADEANNSAGWQWVAGSGADAAPYFRIFNPITQSEKFDADGGYIRRHLPILAHLPAKIIHRPWEVGGVPGYPPPLIDLKFSRERALRAYDEMKHAARR